MTNDLSTDDLSTDDLYALRLACTWASVYWENVAESCDDDTTKEAAQDVARKYHSLWHIVDSLLAERFPA